MIEAVFVISLREFSNANEGRNGRKHRGDLADGWVCDLPDDQQAVLIAFNNPPRGQTGLREWIDEVLTNFKLEARRGEGTLVWLHQGDFRDWGNAFEFAHERGFADAREFGFDANSVVTMSSRVPIGIGGTRIHVGCLITALVSGQGVSVRQGINVLRRPASDAGLQPSVDRELMTRLGHWRHELFRSVGPLRWDLQLGTPAAMRRAEDARGEAAGAVEGMRERISKSTTDPAESSKLRQLEDLINKLDQLGEALRDRTINLERGDERSSSKLLRAISEVQASLAALADEVRE
jgi:hypothetical protein